MNIHKIQKQNYPFLLRQITQLSDEMDVIGTIPPDSYKFLCIIGSRTHSSYGKESCRRIILGLRGYPIVIVSGMAIGIDSIAHETAIDAGLKTIAFPGSGLHQSVIYPYSRKPLAQKIVDSGGALISKFPLFQKATDWTFPVRNRLMAGISHATLITEARRGSGTLITATYSEEFNRDVLAVPGPIDSELSYGSHMLIRRGATPITSSEDVLEALGLTDTTRYDESDERDFKLYGQPPKDKKARKRSLTNHLTDEYTYQQQNNSKIGSLFAPPQENYHTHIDQLSLSSEERSICNYLKIESLSSTDLIEKTSLSTQIFNITMTGLEISGLIRSDGNKWRMR